jgi:hypothetical protein
MYFIFVRINHRGRNPVLGADVIEIIEPTLVSLLCLNWVINSSAQFAPDDSNRLHASLKLY